MTVLSQKMLEDLQLHGFSERTQDSYLSAVRQLARHYHKSPDRIEEEELRQYFLYLMDESNKHRINGGVAETVEKRAWEQSIAQETLELTG